MSDKAIDLDRFECQLRRAQEAFMRGNLADQHTALGILVVLSYLSVSRFNPDGVDEMIEAIDVERLEIKG